MDFMELARARYSVLDFDTRPIEPEVLEQVLQAGLLAPTACNFQPQRVLVIHTERQKQTLARLTDSALYFDTALLVCYDKKAAWVRPFDGACSGEIDAAIVTTHMMLEATALGLGSIWVMHWDPEKMREAYALDEDLEPAALLVLGYPGPKAEPRPTHLASKDLADILL